MSPQEMAKICSDRWVSSDHVCWLTNMLNKSQSDIYYVYLNNNLHKKSKTFTPMHAGDKVPKKICFLINVGKNLNGSTYFGNYGKPGNHWSLCFVDTVEQAITYGDSLGWPAPANLFEQLQGYIRAVSSTTSVQEYTFSICHNPKSKCSTTGQHKCNLTCAENYPLQKCGSICGVVVMVMAAISSQNIEYFKHLTAVLQPTSRNVPPSFISTPTRYSKYLRLVVGCWLATNHPNILYILPQYWDESDKENIPPACAKYALPKHFKIPPASANTKSTNNKIPPSSTSTKSPNNKIPPASANNKIPPASANTKSPNNKIPPSSTSPKSPNNKIPPSSANNKIPPARANIEIPASIAEILLPKNKVL